MMDPCADRAPHIRVRCGLSMRRRGLAPRLQPLHRGQARVLRLSADGNDLRGDGWTAAWVEGWLAGCAVRRIAGVHGCMDG